MNDSQSVGYGTNTLRSSSLIKGTDVVLFTCHLKVYVDLL